MSIRYLSNLALALGAGFLVVATQAFSPGTAAWIAFALAIGLMALGMAMTGGLRTRDQRAVGGLVAVIGAWTIVASVVFAPTTVVWLAFASAVAIVALAVAGLTAHELTTERVVHSLDATPDREPIRA